jgi:chromosome segregation ATPase
MANNKNNTNELVSDDDDPTAELDVAELRATAFPDAAPASDAHAGNSDDDDTATVRAQAIPEPDPDADQPPETIGRLQHDMEQLRAKWLGFETEISAREEVVSNLQNELDELRSDVAQKQKLLKKRNKKIRTLKSGISALNRDHEQLAEEHAASLRQLADQTTTAAEQSDSLADAVRELDAARSELQSESERVASLEAALEARDEAHSSLRQRHDALTEELEDLRTIDADHVAALERAEVELQARRTELETASEEMTGLLTKIAEKDEAKALLDEQHAELQRQLEDQRSTIAERDAAVETAEHELEEARLELKKQLDEGPPEIVLANISKSDAQDIQAQIARTEEYADTLRNNLADLTESYDELVAERDGLSRSLERMTDQNTELSDEIARAHASIAEMQAVIDQQNTEQTAALDQLQAGHEQEMRNLRFELGEAQETATEATGVNQQLAAELLQAREFKNDLESALSQSDERARGRIEELEKQIRQLTQVTEEFEHKLDSRSSAIHALLGELARKSEQIDSINEIEQVVHDIDDRMSSRLGNESAPGEPSMESHVVLAGDDTERVSRVMIGNIGKQELRFPLFKDRVTIGRTSENDIRIKTSFVSRRHAVVLTEDGFTRVIDSGSRNGLFVNSRRVKDHLLSNGDIVTIGDARLRYVERHERNA